MKIMITDACALTAEEIAWVEEHGLEVVQCSDTEVWDGDPASIDLFAGKLFFGKNPIESFTALRYIQLFMAGFDHMPMDYIHRHGIEFHNARDAYSDPIAEFAIGALLSLYKELRAFDEEQRSHIWNMRPYLRELADKRVLVVGAGSIGAAFAKRLQAFDCHVTGLARSAGQRQWFDKVLAMTELDAQLPKADVVIVCLPSNEATYHILDESRLCSMKPDAVLINIARGPIVDEMALIRVLQSGHLMGAVLDVFETEPLPKESPLWDMKNVIVTPHSSFGGEYNQRRLFSVMKKNLLASGLV